MMLHSLRFRLVFMLMLVVMVAVGTVALLASQATVSDLHIYAQSKDDQQITATMLTAYTQHESQAALQKLAEQLARSSHRHIILFDHQRRVLVDSERILIGKVLPEGPGFPVTFTSSQVGVLSRPMNTPADPPPPLPSSLYISTDLASSLPGQSVVTSFQGMAFSAGGSPETSFIDSVNRSL